MFSLSFTISAATNCLCKCLHVLFDKRKWNKFSSNGSFPPFPTFPPFPLFITDSLFSIYCLRLGVLNFLTLLSFDSDYQTIVSFLFWFLFIIFTFFSLANYFVSSSSSSSWKKDMLENDVGFNNSLEDLALLLFKAWFSVLFFDSTRFSRCVGEFFRIPGRRVLEHPPPPPQTTLFRID